MKSTTSFCIIIETLVLIFSTSINLSFAQIFTSNIDTAFVSDVNNKLYLLKGDQYVRPTLVIGEGASMDEGYPQPISNWVGLSN